MGFDVHDYYVGSYDNFESATVFVSHETTLEIKKFYETESTFEDYGEFVTEHAEVEDFIYAAVEADIEANGRLVVWRDGEALVYEIPADAEIAKQFWAEVETW